MLIPHRFLLPGHEEATRPRIKRCFHWPSHPRHCSSVSQLFSETQRFQIPVEYFRFIFTWLIKTLFLRSHWFLRISASVVYLVGGEGNRVANWLYSHLNEIVIKLVLVEYVDSFTKRDFEWVYDAVPYLHRLVSDEEESRQQLPQTSGSIRDSLCRHDLRAATWRRWVRHSTEMQNLRWCQIEWYPYLNVSIFLMF